MLSLIPLQWTHLISCSICHPSTNKVGFGVGYQWIKLTQLCREGGSVANIRIKDNGEIYFTIIIVNYDRTLDRNVMSAWVEC